MKKYLFLFFYLFLISFCFPASNVFIDANGKTKIMQGNIVHTVNGETGDVVVASSYIGEIIEYSTTTAIAGSTSLGTYTDCLADCTLPAGNWQIAIRGTTTGVCTSGTGVVGIYASFVLADNANNILCQDSSGFSNATSEWFFTSHSFIYNVSITTATTYKLRFCAIANSGSPTCGGISAVATANSPIYFKALRIK
jgi:hypothetical protein